MKWLQFLQDGDGMLSSNRLVYVSWSLVILCLIIYLTVLHGEIPKFDTSLVLLYCSVVGGKVVQSFAENVTSSNTTQ